MTRQSVENMKVLSSLVITQEKATSGESIKAIHIFERMLSTRCANNLSTNTENLKYELLLRIWENFSILSPFFYLVYYVRV